MTKIRFALRLVTLISVAMVGQLNAGWYVRTEAIMGTSVSAEIWAETPEQGELLLDAVMAEMHRIDELMSPFKETSELTFLNTNAGRGEVKASKEMMQLLATSSRLSEATDGAFDITFGSVGRFYDYREARGPTDEELKTALEAINYQFIELNWEEGLVRYLHPLVYVDLGGIAKGYAVDRCIDLLKKNGIQRAMVAAGGDSRILGSRTDRPWTVGIRHPRDETRMVAILPLEDTAVSTSGDYERYFEKDGVRYHHILDPGTGKSAAHVRSVTIIGPQATLNDGLSTSVFVLGVDDGLALINQMPGIDAVIIDAAGQLHYSEELEKLTRPVSED